MNMDSLSIVIKSVTDKMTNGLKGAINVWKQYSDTIDKTANTMNKIPNSTTNANNGFAKSKQQIIELEHELKKLQSTYDAHSKSFGDRLATSSKGIYNPTLGTKDFDPNKIEIITKESLSKEKQKINELQQKIKELRGETKKPIQQKVEVQDSTQKLNNVGKSIKVAHGNVRGLSSGFGSLKKSFSDFTKGFGQNIESNVKQIKKFALGLIGVRTAMSVLTKAVNSYLSFDSELQDSLTNSWNMLGSLLAPAIEFVARMFALATNYIAQFVNALTGINLVARANAKSLQTQAKANAQANKEAQRGLLGMDEITNLPTEPSAGGGGGSAPQIQMDDTIKSFKALDDILNHLKNGEWHLVGEDIAKGINRLLYSIDWAGVKEKAYKLGWNFADFLNGLFEVDWSQLGTTIAETMNTFVLLVQGFLDRFSFIQLGGGLARMLNHAFLDFDWDNLAETINTYIQKVGDGISIFLETFEWGDIGKKFGEFVAKIDWGNLLFTAIKNSVLLTTGLINFIIGFFEGLFEEVGRKITAKVTTIFNDLKNGNTNFLNVLGSGIKNAFKGILNTVISTLNSVIRKFNTFLSPLRAIIVALGNIAGKKWTMNNISLPTIPTLATGTNDIEYEGLYHLHEGEAVVPKQYNPATGGYDNSADNKQIIDLLISLNSSMIEYANRPIDISMNSRKVAEAIYSDTQQLNRNRNESTAVVRS